MPKKRKKMKKKKNKSSSQSGGEKKTKKTQLRDNLNMILGKAQRPNNEDHCIKKLKDVLLQISSSQDGKSLFIFQIFKAVKRVLAQLSFKKCKFSVRIFRVLTKFMVEDLTQKTIKDEDDSEDDDARILFHFLNMLLEYTTVRRKELRFRVCELVSMIMKALPLTIEVKEREDHILNKMKDKLLKRCHDRVFQVRKEAVYSLHRLQGDPVVLKTFIRMLKSDGNHLVRRAVVARLLLHPDTYDILIARSRDIKTNVRVGVFEKFKTEKVDNLTVEQRVKLFKNGLEDVDEKVRKAAVNLLHSWYEESRANSMSSFMTFFNVKEHPDECEKIANSLMKYDAKYVQVQYIVDLISDPTENEEIQPRRSSEIEGNDDMELDVKDFHIRNIDFSDEDLFMWHCVSSHLQRKGDEINLQKIFGNIKSVREFCELIIKFIGREYQFHAHHLLKISRHIDYHDEFGRLTMTQLLTNMLIHFHTDKPDLLVDEIVELFSIVVPKEDDLRHHIIVAIDTLIKNKKDVKKKEEINVQEEEGIDDEVDDPNYIRALKILSIIVHNSSFELTHYLYLMNRMVLVCVNSENDEVRKLAFLVLGQFAVRNFDIARRHFPSIVKEFREYKTLVEDDISLTFSHSDCSVLKVLIISIFDVMWNWKILRDQVDEIDLYNDLLYMYYNYEDDDEVSALVIEGFCRLVMEGERVGMAFLPKLLVRIILSLFDDRYNHVQMVRQMIAKFFSIFPRKIDDVANIANVFMAVLRYAIVGNNCINVNEIGKFLIVITGYEYLENTNDKDKGKKKKKKKGKKTKEEEKKEEQEKMIEEKKKSNRKNYHDSLLLNFLMEINCYVKKNKQISKKTLNTLIRMIKDFDITNNKKNIRKLKHVIQNIPLDTLNPTCRKIVKAHLKNWNEIESNDIKEEELEELKRYEVDFIMKRKNYKRKMSIIKEIYFTDEDESIIPPYDANDEMDDGYESDEILGKTPRKKMSKMKEVDEIIEINDVDESPNLDDASPDLNEISPDLDLSSPNLDDASPNLDDASPDLDVESPDVETSNAYSRKRKRNVYEKEHNDDDESDNERQERKGKKRKLNEKDDEKDEEDEDDEEDDEDEDEMIDEDDFEIGETPVVVRKKPDDEVIELDSESSDNEDEDDDSDFE